ncbi:MAG: flagellin, partial [Lachnospiraceae bacterium]|nr:flagellin [Lachnospiraceae bacterium]
MQINSNITAVITNNSLLRNESAFALSTGKLSSGYKINTAGDDPTGYAISGRMRQQLEALKRADINATTGRSVLDTADGALSEVTDMIQRLNEIAIKASNGTMSANDRADMQNEVEQLTAEIERISGQIELNGKKLIDGSLENHGYCENNKNIHVEEYNDKVKADFYNFTLEEEMGTDANGNKILKVTVENLPETWGLSASGNKIEMEFNYPAYFDPERTKNDSYGKADLGEEVSAGTYNDGTKGSVKICEDGSQFITLKGANGESLTLAIDSVVDGVKIYTDSPVAEGTYHGRDFRIEKKTIELTITGEGAMDLHIGANEEEMIKCSIPKMSLKRLDLDDLDVGTMAGAQNAIDR